MASLAVAESKAIEGLDQTFVCLSVEADMDPLGGAVGKDNRKNGWRGQQPCANNVDSRFMGAQNVSPLFPVALL